MDLTLSTVVETQPRHVPVLGAGLLQGDEGQLPIHAVAQGDFKDGDVAHARAGHVMIPQVQSQSRA